jgi:hypothetical protein
MSPKGHPEIAGLGIEYSWGKSKMEYRRLNDCVPKHMHANILESFEFLTLERVRKYARKTREYKRAYRIKHGQQSCTTAESLEGFAAVQKFVKHSASHRCTLDQDLTFLRQT